MALRKNQAFLTAAEKKRFTDALLALKAEQKPGNTNTYDQFVKLHYDNVDAGHGGPAFFPWHRQFLKKFEAEVQRVSRDPNLPDLGLPYWDWTLYQSKNPPSWGSDFLGGDGNSGQDWQVMDGPFAYNTKKWPLNVRTNTEPNPYLRRQLERVVPSLPSQADRNAALSATPYDVYPWGTTAANSFRNRAEGFFPDPFQMHNRVHMWVGGSMSSMTSPNDPVFWLHHCFMDKLWVDWQLQHPNEERYLPPSGARTGHNLNDLMAPWNQDSIPLFDKVKPADELSQWPLGYHYDSDGLLLAGETLYPGQWIWSSGRACYLRLRSTDGILEFIRLSDNKTLWKSDNPANSNVGSCIMQADGNLVTYDTSHNPIWSSKTPTSIDRYYLWVQDNGYVVIRRPADYSYLWYQPK